MPSLQSIQRAVPNALSLGRMLAAPIIALMLWVAPPPNVGAALLFGLAAWTDYLDGDLARRWKVVSPAGIFFDLTADKILVSTLLIVLIPMNLVPTWMVVIVVSREFLISGLRSYAAAKGVVIPAGSGGKSKTAITLVALACTLMRVNDALDNGLLLISTVLTVVSAVDYLVKGWQVRFRPE